jgi:DNA-directed RNA polymerase beta subunit
VPVRVRDTQAHTQALAGTHKRTHICTGRHTETHTQAHTHTHTHIHTHTDGRTDVRTHTHPHNHARMYGCTYVGIHSLLAADGEAAGGPTHWEVAPTHIFSVVANITPFPDFNQSPRNMYQCQVRAHPCSHRHTHSYIQAYAFTHHGLCTYKLTHMHTRI